MSERWTPETLARLFAQSVPAADARVVCIDRDRDALEFRCLAIADERELPVRLTA